METNETDASVDYNSIPVTTSFAMVPHQLIKLLYGSM